MRPLCKMVMGKLTHEWFITHHLLSTSPPAGAMGYLWAPVNVTVALAAMSKPDKIKSGLDYLKLSKPFLPQHKP